MKVDLIINNVQLATMDQNIGEPFGAIFNAQVGIKDGHIVWAESRQPPGAEAVEVFDGQGGWLTPGLIDCHTHLVYGGNRATEWESRLEGVSYEEIARRGGGIVSTVRATRSASFDELLALAQRRLEILLAEGVTCVEIKSGYGLETKTERKMLEVAQTLGENNPVSVSRTFLGAHALPPEFQDRDDDYIQFIVNEMLPTLARENLIDAVDVFCEGIGFSKEQSERVFQCARALGLRVKGHVEQLSNLSGARLVAEYDGLSVDHLEYLADEDIPVLKEHGVTAVLLPGAYYFLGETRQPPIQKLREAGVPLAIATDLNPGSSPVCSLLFIMNMACVQFGLTPEEALTGVTRNAAMALGRGDSKGVIGTGMDADLVLWQIDHPAELSYGVNMSKPASVWVGGKNTRLIDSF